MSTASDTHVDCLRFQRETVHSTDPVSAPDHLDQLLRDARTVLRLAARALTDKGERAHAAYCQTTADRVDAQISRTRADAEADAEAFADFITSFPVVSADRFLRARRLWSAMTADEQARALQVLPAVRAALAASITDPLQPDSYLSMRLWFDAR